MIKSLIIVFGEMGCGKTYIGQIFSRHYNAGFYEGDDALNDWNRRMGFYSKESVEKFVRDQLIPAIELQLQSYERLVVSQALYFEDHRQLIAHHFNKHGLIVQFIQIKTPVDQQKKQLLARGYYWLISAFLYRRYFESSHKAYIFNNTEDHTQLKEEIAKLCHHVKQTYQLFESSKSFRYS